MKERIFLEVETSVQKGLQERLQQYEDMIKKEKEEKEHDE